MAKALVRKELKRNDYAKRGLLTVVGAVVVLLLVFAKTTGIIGGREEISAKVANAGGALRPGSDVKMRGVIIGRVADITRAPDGDVLVNLAMADGQIQKVPSNAVARILPATVFGTTFVDLTTHSASSPVTLKAGDQVPADKTQETLELQQALDDIDRLTKALGPAELASALGSAAAALDGRGTQLGGMIDQLDGYMKKLNPKLPAIRTDARKLSENLAILQRNLPDLLTALDDGLITARTVVAEQANITAIIAGATSLSREGNLFFSQNKDPLVRFLSSTGTVVDALFDNRNVAFGPAMETNRRVASLIRSAMKNGFLDVTAVIQTNVPNDYTASQRPRFSSSGARVGAPDLGRASVSQLLEGTEDR